MSGKDIENLNHFSGINLKWEQKKAKISTYRERKKEIIDNFFLKSTGKGFMARYCHPQ